MELNIIRYLKEADQKTCPLISLEVSCNMTTFEEIRRLPQHYERLSCRRVLQFVGDNPNVRVVNPNTDQRERLNILLFHLIDDGWDLKDIGEYLQNA